MPWQTRFETDIWDIHWAIGTRERSLKFPTMRDEGFGWGIDLFNLRGDWMDSNEKFVSKFINF